MRHPLLLALLLAACSRGGALPDDDLGEPMTQAPDALGPDDLARDLLTPDLRPCDTAAGWRICGAVCVSPLGDDNNCGACGRTCPPGDLGARAGCCNAQCVDKASNTSHCGSCFNVCGGAAPWCCAGACSSVRCS